MLQVKSLQDLCELRELKNLTSNNCLDVYIITISLGLQNLNNSALKLVLWNLNLIIKSENFKKQRFEDILILLSLSEFHIVEENLVVCAIIEWVEFDEANRRKYLYKLLHCIDFTRISATQLSSMTHLSPIISDQESAALISEICKRKPNDKDFTVSQSTIGEWDNLLKFSRFKYLNKLCSENLSVQKTSAILLARKDWRKSLMKAVVTGYQKVGASKSYTLALYYYDPAKNFVEELNYNEKTEDSKRRSNVLNKLCTSYIMCSGFSMCAIGSVIYLMGGEFSVGHNRWNPEFWSYDTWKDEWKLHDSSLGMRRHHMTCVIGDTIYICGGFKQFRVQAISLHAYNTKTETWKDCANPPASSLIGGVSVCFKENMFVFLNGSLFIYITKENAWITQELNLTSTHGFQSAVTYDDFIILLACYSTQLYKYTPENATMEIWKKMQHPTINMCVVDDHLYSFTHAEYQIDGKRVIEALTLNNNNEMQSRTLWQKDHDSGGIAFMPANLSKFSPGCFGLGLI